MIEIKPEKRPTSANIYGEFKNYYIKNYVKNSGLYSVVQCLFSFPNFEEYFTNEFKIGYIMETQYPKKIALIMISLIQSLKDKKNYHIYCICLYMKKYNLYIHYNFLHIFYILI